MVDVPQLPTGPVRLIAIAGSIAIVAFATTAGILAARKRWREARWAALALALSLATMAVHRAPGWHVVLAAVTLAAALRNAVCLDASPRMLTIAGVVAWLVAVVAGHALFH